MEEILKKMEKMEEKLRKESMVWLQLNWYACATRCALRARVRGFGHHSLSWIVGCLHEMETKEGENEVKSRMENEGKEEKMK